MRGQPLWLLWGWAKDSRYPHNGWDIPAHCPNILESGSQGFILGCFIEQWGLGALEMMAVDIDFNCIQCFECTFSCKFYTEPVEVISHLLLSPFYR